MEVDQRAQWPARSQRERGAEGSGGRGDEEEEEATHCQISVWQSSVASGTVTTSATAASVVVAVRWRPDGGKRGKTEEVRVKEDNPAT